MYSSIIDTDMFTLRGSHPFERMDEAQLADLGIERKGNVFLRHGKVIHEIRKFEIRTLLDRFASLKAPTGLKSARA